MTEDQEILTEFIIETNENLARLNQDLVNAETRPRNAELLGSIFRTFHTIKGTTGFLGFSKLESLTHITENILSQVRDGERPARAGFCAAGSGFGARHIWTNISCSQQTNRTPVHSWVRALRV